MTVQSSPKQSDSPKRVAVVGGGIAGLATAFELVEQGEKSGRHLDVTLFESKDRPGGNILTESDGGYTAEWGPNGFLDNVPATLDLVGRLGLDDALHPSSDSASDRYLYRRGKLHSLPTGAGGFLGSSLLSLPGRLRVFLEPFQGGAGCDDESVYSFASRRIGREAASVLVDSMVSGVFAGNVQTLSLRSAFPKMFDMERQHGTLTRAMIHKMREARKRGSQAASAGGFSGTLTSFRGGLSVLIDALHKRLGERVRLRCAVGSIERHGSSYTLRTEMGGEEADAVVMACPAWHTALVLDRFDPEIAGELGEISSAPVAVVCTGFDPSSVGREVEGFGFLVPRGEQLRILGSLWTSSIFRGRAPDGKVLLRNMIGGAHDGAALQLSDDELVDIVIGDLRGIMDLRGDPEWTRIFRFPRGIPQYDVGHHARLKRIESALLRHPGLFLTGNSYRGVAINSCVEEAGKTAAQVLEQIAR